MSILTKLFGRSGDKSAPEDEPVAYKGFKVRPAPIVEGSEYRLAAWIEKDIDGELKTHHLVRADMTTSRETAVDAAIAKAKLVIDEQGEQLFD